MADDGASRGEGAAAGAGRGGGAAAGALTIAYVVGARPNYVKTAPVVRALHHRLPEARHIVINTGQHYDREMAEIFFEELELGKPAYELGVGSGAHGAQTAKALERIEEVLLQERPDALLVPGDVNSTLAGALAAAKLGIPVGHIESGLRCYDRTMPEELNRLLTDQLSEWLFTHSPEALANLEREGIPAERVHLVGNTMIDTLMAIRPRVEHSRIHASLGIEPGGYCLVTLHRPVLVDGPLLPRALAALTRLAATMPVVFPMHPRTRARLGETLPEVPGLTITGPVGYVDFLALELRARCVVTDSGGVQEETTSLGVPCFTLRANTERPVTVTQGTNRLLGLAPEEIDRVPQLLAEAAGRPVPPQPEGWDGHAAERLAEILARDLEARATTGRATTGRATPAGA